MRKTIKDIMGEQFTSVEAGSPLGIVEAKMSMGNVREVLVVDEQGKLTGILSRADLHRAQDKGSRGRVSDYMTRRMWTVHVTDEAIKAADAMIANHIGVVPVVDAEDRPVGVVSDLSFIVMARAQLAAVTA